MRVFRSLAHPGLAPACALTIGNFDGVHLGHQAMLERLRGIAGQTGLKSSAMTFEPHPRDYFAALRRDPTLAPARISTLRDKLQALADCGIDQAIVLRFDATFAAQSPQDFVNHTLQGRLGARHILVGDDFRFGSKRAGDFALLQQMGQSGGFAVHRMESHLLAGERVSSSAVRQALQAGQMQRAAALLGRPYTISGHVLHGRRLGRHLSESAPGAADGIRTLNLRFYNRHHAWKPATTGIFVARVRGLGAAPLAGVANLGVRPTLDANDVNGGRVLLETHCLDWPDALGPEGGYGKIIAVELLHKLHDERRYHNLLALADGIAQDIRDARDWLAGQDERI